VLNLLEAVDGVTTALSGEKYSTLSWCLPLLFGLRDAAKCDENDCMILVGIKKLTNQLNERFHLDELEMDSPPVLAAALDPSCHFSPMQNAVRYMRFLLRRSAVVIAVVQTRQICHQ